MPVRDIAQTNVVTAAPETQITDVVAQMAAENVGSVVVLDEDTMVGLLTDRSIALALRETPDASELVAGDVMTEDVLTAHPDDDVLDVLERMDAEGVRRMPVVEPDGSLFGIVALDDVLVMLATELGHVSDLIKKQSPRF